MIDNMLLTMKLGDAEKLRARFRQFVNAYLGSPKLQLRYLSALMLVFNIDKQTAMVYLERFLLALGIVKAFSNNIIDDRHGRKHTIINQEKKLKELENRMETIKFKLKSEQIHFEQNSTKKEVNVGEVSKRRDAKAARKTNEKSLVSKYRKILSSKFNLEHHEYNSFIEDETNFEYLNIIQLCCHKGIRKTYHQVLSDKFISLAYWLVEPILTEFFSDETKHTQEKIKANEEVSDSLRILYKNTFAHDEDLHNIEENIAVVNLRPLSRDEVGIEATMTGFKSLQPKPPTNKEMKQLFEWKANMPAVKLIETYRAEITGILFLEWKPIDEISSYITC